MHGESLKARGRAWRSAHLDRYARSPISPAWVVLVLYLAWIGIQLPYSHGARDFIHIGVKYMGMGHGSSAIVVDSYVAQQSNPGGYDGQFYYYMALDPLHAASYIDLPAERMSRIVYPMLARTLAAGQANLVPYAMLAINLLALGGMTFAAAAWLARRRLSVWFSLIPGLYPGFLLGFKSDLTEPLAYAFVALGIYLFDYGGKSRLGLSAAAFALATLTRETTVLFPLAYGAGLLSGWRPVAAGGSTSIADTWTGAEKSACDRSHGIERCFSRIRTFDASGLVFLALALGPFVAYRLFLRATLGSVGVYSPLIETHPFGGLLAWYPWQPAQQEVMRNVYFPGILCGCACVWALVHTWRLPRVWALLANVLLFVVFLSADGAWDLTEAGRDAVGVVLAAVYCLPELDRALKGNRWWLWASSALWLALMPFWLIEPIVDSFFKGHA